jgi:hypothetical protein
VGPGGRKSKSCAMADFLISDAELRVLNDIVIIIIIIIIKLIGLF